MLQVQRHWLFPFNYSFSIGTQSKKPNSKVGGVQLGLTTYCYRSIPHNLEEVLQYVLTSGVNSLEMRSVLEEGLGIPQAPPQPAQGVVLTEAEKAERQRKWQDSGKSRKNGDWHARCQNTRVYGKCTIRQVSIFI